MSRFRTPGIVNSLPYSSWKLVKIPPAMTNAPVTIQTSRLDLEEYHIIALNQTPVRHTVSSQPNLSTAQLASRKLIQKSVKMLNTPKTKDPLIR